MADRIAQQEGHAGLDLSCAGCLPQIHLQADGCVHLFSRNCEDRSASFPDVADAVRAAAAGAALKGPYSLRNALCH